MKAFSLQESNWATLALTKTQAADLAALGRRLASQTGWWGDDPDEEQRPRSVIEVRPDTSGNWDVYVREAVGVIAVDGAQITVAPKIPQSHFLYLAQVANVFPRIDPSKALVDLDQPLWQVVFQWYLAATERLLRQGLLKGYVDYEDEVRLARGRIKPLETVQAIYAGRPAFACEYEEFSEDIALNRVIKAAAGAILAVRAPIDVALRHRAQAILSRMTEIGPARPEDFRVQVDRLSSRYSDSLSFAKVVLKGGGTHVAHASARGWCFLIPTPQIVEAGILALLAAGLGPDWEVAKRKVTLPGSHLTLNPDLVFNESVATGDVKYKVFGNDWVRADLYQAVTFAAGFRTTQACIVGFFVGNVQPQPAALQVGDVRVQFLGWLADPAAEPEEVAAELVISASSWLRGFSRGQRRPRAA